MGFLPSISATVASLLMLLLIYEQNESVTAIEALSKVCLGCICEASSGCNITLGCDDSVCGPFRITWNYWVDAGKPVIDDNSNSNQERYMRCVSDIHCAARTIQGYMDKFAQDCNEDGQINCDDFLRIHRLGAYGCSAPLNTRYENTFKFCMETFGKL